MDRFQEMRVYTAVVNAGSFVRAADDLQISKAATSRYVADLEARLGVRLLQRTTRKLSLTEEGEVFYTRCKTLLNELDETEAEITSRAGEASGQLKINAPLSFGLLHLASLWPEFMAKHPKVSLDVTLGDRTIDLIEEGFDLAVRIGEMPSSSLISRKLGKTRMVLCASPEYVKKQGIPIQPSDLAVLDVISYNLLAMGEDWQFFGPNGGITVKVHPRMRTNSGDTCRMAALLGQGIVLQPSFLIGADLASGALVELLPEYRSVELGIYAVYPTRKFVAPKVRLLIDFLVEALRQSNWQDL